MQFFVSGGNTQLGVPMGAPSFFKPFQFINQVQPAFRSRL